MLVRLFVLLVVTAATAVAQWPRPHPVFLPPAVQRAVDAGTRTLDGHPDPRHWQNRAAYRIDARLDPSTTPLTASGMIAYTNASPDTLWFLILKLRQNVHAPGVPRNRTVTGDSSSTTCSSTDRGLRRSTDAPSRTSLPSTAPS